MDKYKLINNKTNLKVFDNFNEVYGAKALSFFPNFEEIQIYAVYHYDSSDKDSFNAYDTFGFYYDYMLNPKYAEIIINEDSCIRFELTEPEMFAAIGHELGHIKYKKQNRTNFQDQITEIDSDDFVCHIGLGRPLISLLNKLINSGDYPEELYQGMKERLFVLSINPLNR